MIRTPFYFTGRRNHRAWLLAIAALMLGAPGCATRSNSNSSDASPNARSVIVTDAYHPRQLIQGAQSVRRLPHAHRTLAASELLSYWRDTGGDALIVWQDGEVLVEAYSKRSNPDTRFRSLSMHKSIVGIAASTMAAEGLISLDDEIGSHVSLIEDPTQPITIRNALQHLTGLERYPTAPMSEGGLRLAQGPDIEAAALEARQTRDPKIFDYANLNYQLAGAALRAALQEKLGVSYADYLSERIWRPIGNGDAYLWAESETGAPRFYAGLQATARDWTRGGAMIADNGVVDGRQVIEPSVIAEFLKPSPSNPEYGLGVWLGAPDDGIREYGPSVPTHARHSAPFDVDDVVFFDGSGGQRVYISPQKRLVVVRFGEIRSDWDDARLFNLAAAMIKRDAANAGTIDIREEVVSIPGTQRQTNLRIYAPKQMQPRTRIVFSHGAFSAPERYDRLLTPLAARGALIVAPLHVDSELHPARDDYARGDWTRTRLEDIETAQQRIQSGAIGGGPWIAMGHSLGALMAQATGGAKIHGLEASARFHEPPARIIALSPPGPYGDEITAQTFSSISAPMLVVTGTKDILPGATGGWSDHLLSYEASTAPARALIFDDVDHYFNGLFGRPTNREDLVIDEILIDQLWRYITDGDLKAMDGPFEAMSK